MKSMPIHSAILALLMASGAGAQVVSQSAGQNGGDAGVKFTERITDEEFQALRKARTPTETIAPELARRSYDIMEMSDFIVFDGISTLVPKGAILNLPIAYRENLAAGPKGRLLLWQDFLTRNRARITPFEITMEEAAGAKRIDPQRLEQAMRGGTIIVAVIHGSPTSVTTRAPEADAAPAPDVALSR